MGGLNIDINQSLSTQSSGSESNFVESSQKNEGLLHSLACVVDEISKQGSFNIQSSGSLVYKYEKTDAVLHQEGALSRDPSKRFSPDHLLKMGFKDDPKSDLLKMGFKDDPKSDLLKRVSSDADQYKIDNFYQQSVSNQICVNMKCDERSFDCKEHSMCMLNTPQEKSSDAPDKQQPADVFLSSTSGSPGESTCALQKANLKDTGNVGLKDTGNVGKSFFNRTEVEPNKGKGKERISQTSDTSKSFSKGQNDSYESVDSISSKMPIFLGKRDSCFEMDGNSECTKRFKRENDEVSFPRPVVHSGGSFFNWISTVANGIPRNSPPEVPMAVVPSPPRGRMANSLTPLLQKKDEDLDGHTGFGSFVKALYQPGLEMAQAASAMHESKCGVHHIDVDRSRDHAGHTREGFKVVQSVPLSVLRSHGYQLEEFSPENVRNSTSSHSPFPGTLQHVPDENRNACNWGSTSSSTQNCSLRVTTKSSSSRFSSSGSEFLGSSWITRLCSKPVRMVLMQLDQGESSATEMPVFDTKYSPQIQNNDLLLEGNLHLLQHVDQTDGTRHGTRHQEQTSVMPDSNFVKRSRSDQKLKCKLNPIVPSPMLKKLEPVTSIFAKRLNALRQIKPSAVPNKQELNLMCFFCGMTGHDMGICPEITRSDEDLLKNIDSWDWLPSSSNICIRCFRLNHWAVACPYVALKPKRPSGSVFRDDLVNFPSELEYDQKHFYSPSNKSQLLLKKDELGSHEESSNFQVDSTDPLNFRNPTADVNSSVPNVKN